MDWQLEHHLFPTMPRYRYPALSKVLKAFADEHGLGYRVTPEWELLATNVALLARVAGEEAVPGNPDSTPKFMQVQGCTAMSAGGTREDADGASA